MAFGLRWAGSGAFLATEIRVQLHEWLAIVTGTLTPGALLIFVAVLAPGLIGVTLIGSLVYSMFLIGQRVLNEAAYIRIDHKLNELYHASPLTPEAYFVGIAGGMLVAYLPPSLVVLAILEVLHPLSAAAWLVLAACLIAVWAVSATIGYVVSTLFKDMKTIWPYSALLTNLFGIVPPVFYPLRLVPVDWRPLVLLLPTSAAAALVNGAAGLGTLSSGEAVLAMVALGTEAIGMFAFGIYWARRMARET
jgi:ABC-2 type transport system permease protein